jgi:hypothetical protein
MDIRSKKFAQLVREIARRNQTDPDIVRNVIISEFECARVNMKEANVEKEHFPYILLPYLFTFKILPRKKRYYINRLKNTLSDVYTKRRESGN